MRMNNKLYIFTFLMFLLIMPATTLAMQDLGALTAQQAHAYMLANEDVVIIDVRDIKYYEKEHFAGAIHIWCQDMSECLDKVPQGAKVILHCHRGGTVRPAYLTLRQGRPDLEAIGFIDGEPMMKQYNEWVKKNR